MKLKAILIAILVSSAFYTCSSDDDSFSSTPENTDISLITGLNLRSSNVSPPIQLGNPNILIDGFLFVTFPNPTSDVLTIQSNGSISDVWMILQYSKHDSDALFC